MKRSTISERLTHSLTHGDTHTYIFERVIMLGGKSVILDFTDSFKNLSNERETSNDTSSAEQVHPTHAREEDRTEDVVLADALRSEREALREERNENRRLRLDLMERERREQLMSSGWRRGSRRHKN